jgi:diguanylate cyclase
MPGRLIAYLRRWLSSTDFRESAVLVPAPVMKPPAEGPEGVSRAQAVVSRLTELTATVAEDVGKHTDNIQHISTELTSLANNDASAVAAVVCKLVFANQDLQGRLERAELKLQAHSRQLQDVAVAARTDSLTGLMNRRALDEELRRCLKELERRGRPSAMLLLDVDHFKRFNDTHGHLAGDEALKYVADALRAQARETDIVARFGGEEFAIIFAATTAQAVSRRAEQMRHAISQGKVVFEGRELQVTASAGLADTKGDTDIAQWLKRADTALYAAKNGGRNCTYWSRNSELTRIEPAARDQESSVDLVEHDARVLREAAADLAAEAFADTTFVPDVSRRIAEWKRGGSTFSVMLARLDGEGDGTGDGDVARQAAIRAALQLARECVRDMDLLTRWTSDGLAVLLPGAGVTDARTAARRLHAALARCEQCGGLKPSMSMGIAEGIEGNDCQRVLTRAWLALDAARQAGPGNIFVHDGLKTLAVRMATAAR